MQSIWEENMQKPAFPTLKKDISTNVLIIGGGISGILCAYMLQQAGADYVLAEADRICSGITKNTTAKITSQHGLIYHTILKKCGTEYAKLYLQANEKAVRKFKKLSKNIDCDFVECDSFVYSLDDSQKIQKELAALSRIGYSAKYYEQLDVPFPIAGAVCFPNQAQFHPLKFLYGISKDLNIFEQTKIRELVGLTAITDKGKINARKIIVTTHFPSLNKHGLYPLKLYQHRSYVIALENAQKIAGMYVDASIKGLSFRNYKDLLLLGGGSHRTGKQGGAWRELTNFARQYYPKATVKYQWATQDCMSLDHLPYIGPYSQNTEGLFVATGFNKWGMTTSMLAASILSDMVQGKSNPYTTIFSPSRSIFQPQLAINGVESVMNLLTPSAKRCPHLGCALKWNEVEHTWDCPCHGSRFTAEGKLIDNPATGNLRTGRPSKQNND